MRNRRGLGGPLDLIHSAVVIIIAAVMLKLWHSGQSLDPIYILVIASVLIVAEILGIMM